MAKFGHKFLSGLAWTAIGVAVGIWGSTIGGIFGWILSLAGFGCAVLCALRLYRITSYTIKAQRMMRDNPEQWARMKRNYEDAMKRLDEK